MSSRLDADDEREHHLHERTDRRRVARRDELPARTEQRDQQPQVHRRLLEVEALRQMGGGRRRDHDDREHPGAALAPREAAREPDRPHPERQHERPRRGVNAGRQHALHELDPIGHLRGQRGDDRQEARTGCQPREQSRSRRTAHVAHGSLDPGRMR